MTTIPDLLRKLPDTPGVYQFLDESGGVIYIGKAKSLKNRVRSYFNQSADHSPKTLKLIEQAVDLRWIETGSEMEALTLEANLVREHQPKFNVLLRDDKHFLYFKVTTNEDFPRVLTVRKVEKDGARYFGPKTNSAAVHDTLKLIRKLFKIRSCGLDLRVGSSQLTDSRCEILDASCEASDQAISASCHGETVQVLNKTMQYPCLDADIGLCPAPCVGRITRADYAQITEQVLQFLAGNTASIVRDLTTQMQAAAIAKNFELAANLRDKIQSLQVLKEKNLTSDPDLASRDVLGVRIEGSRAYLALLEVREGKLLDQKNFTMQAGESELPEILAQFLTQYYSLATELPREILLPSDPPESETLDSWLTERAGHRVALLTPQKGKKYSLLGLAEKNAAAFAVQSKARFENTTERTLGAARELAAALGITKELRRIECYDISHLGGEATVGSMVVFERGEPQNAAYRHFQIRSLPQGQIDDYASLAEVLSRRMSYLLPQFADLQLRRATKKDAPLLESSRWRDPVTGEICDELSDWWVALVGGELAAMVKLQFWPAEKIWGIYHLHVLDQFRGHKLGLALIAKALDRLKVPKAYLDCEPKLVDYYSRLGFRVARQVPPLLEQNLRDFCARHPDHTPFADRTFLVWDRKSQEIDSSFSARPDLVILDGGRGQLSAVLRSVQFPATTRVVALAKQFEEIWQAGDRGQGAGDSCLPDKDSLSKSGKNQSGSNVKNKLKSKSAKQRLQTTKTVLPKDSHALYLVQRIRDESHRFANELRKKILKSEATQSKLDELAGVGVETQKILLKEFGSLARVWQATQAELVALLGAVRGARVWQQLREFDRSDPAI